MGALDKLARLRGVTWTWNDASREAGKEPGTPDAGVIAQDVEAEFPELVETTAEGWKRVNYTGLVGVLVEAVKELKLRNEALEKRVRELEQRREEPARERKP